MKRTEHVASSDNISESQAGSNLGRDTEYPVRGFSWFSLVPMGKFWDNTIQWATIIPFISFPIHYSVLSNHLTL
jgi:hypothetical protein